MEEVQPEVRKEDFRKVQVKEEETEIIVPEEVLAEEKEEKKEVDTLTMEEVPVGKDREEVPAGNYQEEEKKVINTGTDREVLVLVKIGLILKEMEILCFRL